MNRRARPRRPTGIILIGLMGTGKTTVGRLLARRLQAIHLDTDGDIELQETRSVAQIFGEHGEPHFRDLETGLLNTYVNRTWPRRLIISTGGGLPLRPENRELLRRLGQVVWLRATPDTLVRRVSSRIAKRPLLAENPESLHERMLGLCRERGPVYAEVANHIIDTDENSHPGAIADAVLERCCARRWRE